MSWTPPVHVLLCPIADEDELLISQIQLRPLFYGEQTAALAKAGSDEDDQFFELAKLATGLPGKVLDQLKRPDYVSIAQYVHEMSTLPTSHFLEKAAAEAELEGDSRVEPADSENLDVVPLLLPLTAGGAGVDSLTLQMPALLATKAMKKLKTPKERAEFITAHCTGLMIPDLALLTVPDWTQLQERIDDFLNKPAAFFRNATSK